MSSLISFRVPALSVLLFTTAASSLFLLLQTQPATILRATEPVVELGRLVQNEKVVHTVKIVNESDDDVRISAVQSSCACVVSEIAEPLVLPGQTTGIEIEFSANNARGEVTSNLNVFYFAGDSDRLMRLPFSMRASVAPDLDCNVEKLTFNDGMASNEEFVVTPRLLEFSDGLRVSSTHPAFEPTLRPNDITAQVYLVDVAFRPEYWLGSSKRPEIIVSSDKSSLRVPLDVSE